jgi:D-amino-acid oxidase
VLLVKLDPALHPNAAVIGAGVIGLSAALQLLRAGFRVTVIAAAWTPETTSDGAGALWERYDSDARHAKWASETYRHYCALIQAGAGVAAGVGFIEGEQYSNKKEGYLFQSDVLHFRRATPEEVTAASARSGSTFVDGCVWTSVIADSPTYLGWLLQSVRDAGGCCQLRRVGALDELAGGEFSLVINCSGLAARELARDPSLIGVRGQVVRVYAPHITRFAMTSAGA